MPTNRTKRTRQRAGALDHWKLDQLITGDCLLAGVGYAAPIPSGCNHWTAEQSATVREAMQSDWAIHGPAVMAWWRGETEQFTRHPGSPENQRDRLRELLERDGQSDPWAAREFGAVQ